MHFRAVWTTIFSLSVSGGDGFSDVLTAYGTSFLAASFPFSSPEEYSYMGFSGRAFWKCSRILRYLVRQWILVASVTVSVWQQRQVRTVQTVPEPAR